VTGRNPHVIRRHLTRDERARSPPARAQRAKAVASGPPLTTFIASWQLALEAGIRNVHPHRFRRSFADSWLAAGRSTDDLMHITGWKTYGMVREHTEQRGITRAHNAHARLSPGDRI
jgi:integrase